MFKNNQTKHYQLLTVGLTATLLLSGCHNDSTSTSSTAPSTDNPTTPSENVGSILATVVDQISLEPIADATIIVAGQQYTSDAEGRFQLANLKVGDPVTLTITAEGYPERVFTTSVSSSTATEIEYQLNNDATIASVTQVASKPFNVVIEDLGAQVSIPANALRRADGQPIVGSVTVSMDVVTPSEDPEEMPGGYGIVSGGFMESWGALIVTAQDEEKQELVLVDGNVASLIIPVSTRSSAPLQEQMPLFFYDTVQQGWVQTSTASLKTLNSGIQVYTADIEEIGAWNVDMAMETVNAIGCVTDTDGVRLNNVLVKGDGINYSAVTTTMTNSNGDFSLPVRRNSDLYVYAQNGNRTSNAKPIITNENNYRITDGCLVVSTENDNLSIRLTWGEQPSDVDSHLITPSGDHIFYHNQGKLSAAPFASLDVDDVNSFGPEFITVRNLMVGRYRYGVDNYSQSKNPGLKDSPVKVFLAGPAIRSRTLAPTINDNNNSNLFWYAFDLVVDESCNITYESVNRWLTLNDAETTFFTTPSTPSTPTYCTAP